MNYTKNMWDNWKDFRLDEESDDLTKLFEEFQKKGIEEFSAYGTTFSSKEAQQQVDENKEVNGVGKPESIQSAFDRLRTRPTETQ